MQHSFLKNFLYAFTVIAIAFCATSSPVFAAPGVPNIVTYQGRLTDNAGQLLGGSGTNYYFRFSLWSTSAIGGGSKLWPAGQPGTVTTSVVDGVFNVDIGDTANGYPDALTYNFQDSDAVYLQIEVSSDNASFETLGPRQRILSSGYAINAQTVAGLTPGTAANNILTLGSDGEIVLSSTGISTLGDIAAGVISSGTWNGTVIAPAYGGTGVSTITGLIKGNGTSAFTAAVAGTDYEVPLTFSTGLTRTTNTVTVNASQNISTLSNLTTNGIVTTSGGTGALSVTATTGSGSVALATSPVFTTPTLGVASATSLATSAATPFILTNGQAVNVALTSQTVGATTLTIPDFASVADTFVFATLEQTLSNKTFIAPALGTPVSGIATNLTGTASGLTAGNVTTNANLTGAVTSSGNATSLGSFTTSAFNTALSDNDIVTLAGSEALTNKTYNGNTFTTGTGVLTIEAAKTLTISNTLTLAGTDSSTLNIGAGGTLGSAAFTAASAYEVPLTFSTGLTRTTNTITIDSSVVTLTGSQALSNKTGNISQWTNDSGYATGGGTASGTNTGDITLGAIGATPSANGASLSGQVLTLQPADASFGGIMTTGTQSIAGAKTFTSNFTVARTPDAAFIANNTSGKASMLVAGTLKSSFVFDSSGSFTMQTQTKANILTGTPSGVALFEMNSSGEVGIGGTSTATTSGVRLDVFNVVTSDSAATRTALRGRNTGSSFVTSGQAKTNYIAEFTNTATRSTGANDLTNVALYASASGAQLNYAGIFAAGNVGIGDVTPDYTLDVKGTICQDTNSDETCDGSVTSDARLKTNIENIPSALEKIRLLRGVYFDWDESNSHTAFLGRGIRQVGVIAQEIEAVFPSLIYRDSSGYRMVDYQKLTGPLIEAVKELDIQVQALPLFEDQTFAVKIEVFLRGIAEQGEAIIDTVRAKRLCAEDVCIDRDQLQHMIEYINTHQESSQPSNPNPPVEDDTPLQDDGGVPQTPEEEPEEEIVPEPVVELDEPVVEGVPEPEPEPLQEGGQAEPQSESSPTE